MAVAVTYDFLIENVPIILMATNRSLVEDMPNIIALAEEELLQRIDHDLFRTLITGVFMGSGATPPPPDYDQVDLSDQDPRILEVRSINLRYRTEGWTPMLRRNIDTMRMLYPTGQRSRPRYYAEYKSILNYQFFPPPGQEYELEIAANVQYEPLSPTNQTNVVTEQFPRTIEMATVYQAALYMKNPQDVETYKREMEEAINEANLQIARRRRDETGTRPIETTNAVGR